MKKNLTCPRVEILKQVRNDTSFPRHPELVSGSNEMLKPVQHDDKEMGHPEFISGSNVFCHSEFISESDKIRPQVQNDESFSCHSELSSESRMRLPAQHDKSYSLFAKLWARKIFTRTRPQLKPHFSFGRSMIEMLGVLAIIGVLSIGGLYAYKQAMMRYRLNQTQDWLSRMRFAIAVNCDDDDGTKCAFADYSGAGYTKRKAMLCAELGEDFCLGKTYMAPFPFISGITWIMSIEKITSNAFNVFFSGLNKENCEAFIQHDWANLYLIRDYANAFSQRVSAKGKPLTQEQKDLLKARCPFAGYFQMAFYRHD